MEIFSDDNNFIKTAFIDFINNEYNKENSDNLIYLIQQGALYNIKLNTDYYFVQGID